MFDVVVSVALAGTLIVLCADVLHRAVQQRAALQRQAAASRTAANGLERLAAIDYDALTVDRARQTVAGLADAAAGETIDVTVAALAGTPPGKQITVTVSWEQGAGRAAQPVRLSTWRFRSSKADP